MSGQIGELEEDAQAVAGDELVWVGVSWDPTAAGRAQLLVSGEAVQRPLDGVWRGHRTLYLLDPTGSWRSSPRRSAVPPPPR
jgi:hypothetical protein